jgi:hypothetical protein
MVAWREGQIAMSWWKNLLGGSVSKGPDNADRLRERRMAALTARLGPSEENVFHSGVPLFMGGFADVAIFRKYVPGYTYVTMDLVGLNVQKRNRLGEYELMICTREPADWAANLISQLAKYTLEAVLQPGETMDIGPALPAGSRVQALLFAEPDPPVNPLPGLDRKAGVLLCIGIQPGELALVRRTGAPALIEALKRAEAFPWTELQRAAVA